MGFGLHGWGVGAVNWLIKHGAKVTVTDLKNREQLKSTLSRINEKKVKLILGRHREIDFKNTDIVLQNPGVPHESKFIKIAKKFGAMIENDASLFIKNCSGTVIGVTGTRGKSTTSVLMHEFLKSKKVFLAGLPQLPLLDILDKVKKNGLAILELSSWQLEILGQQMISPPVAVIINIYPDHLNRYSGLAEYIEAKANIIRFQGANDIGVVNLDNSATKKLGEKVGGRRYWFSLKYFAEQNGSFVKSGNIYFRENGNVERVCPVKALKLAGEHNLENALAAITVAKVFGAKSSTIKKVLKNFRGLPFRIEVVRQFNGIQYINDTTSTTPDATMAALKTLGAKKRKSENGKIVLIAGGTTKNIPDEKFKQLAGLIKQNCKALILFKGDGSRQILRHLKKIKYQPVVFEIGSMAGAVALANSFAQKRDIVLLSPACASFNMFINEYDRGEQFNRIVNKIN